MRPVEDPDAWPAAPRGVLRLICFTVPALLVLTAISWLVRS